MNLNRIGMAVCGVLGLLGVSCGEEATEVPPPTPKDPIQVRTMTVLTGSTSENGAPYYAGIKDAIRETNDTGGIKGYLIEEKTVDHSYMKDKWVAAYADWKANDPTFDKVIQFFSWGTPDTQEFSKEATTREVPWISGSYATTLATPLPQRRTISVPTEPAPREFVADGAPFNFFAGTDYSTQIRIGMDFVKKKNGTKIAFAYCTASAFCKEPIPPGKTYAAAIGITIAPDVNPELNDTEAAIDTKVQTYAASNPDVQWFWVGNSIFTSTFFAKAVKKYLPNAKLIMNLYGMDERTFGLCGDACVGNTFSVQAFSAFGDLRHAGMEELVRVYNKWRTKDGEPEDKWRNMRYVQGYVSFFLFRRGVESLIDQKKELTGKNLKAAYESFRNLNTGGLTPPISFTAEDHRPTNITRIYSMNAQGKLQFEDEINIQLQSEWLGW
jgi:branched-chain amino acid transport system substrate-binding protein